MQFPNLFGNGALHISLCQRLFIFQVVQIYRLIRFLGSIIETLSGKFTQLCSNGFQNHCLSQIQICLCHASILKGAFMFHGARRIQEPGPQMDFLFAGGNSPYIFPPFSLFGRILMKLKVEEVSDVLVIVPWWPTAHWYPPLLQLLVQCPILLPQWDELLTLPREGFLHPLKDVMRNAPGRVACIRDHLQVRGISPRASSYVLKSWRPGREKQYSAAWE